MMYSRHLARNTARRAQDFPDAIGNWNDADLARSQVSPQKAGENNGLTYYQY